MKKTLLFAFLIVYSLSLSAQEITKQAIFISQENTDAENAYLSIRSYDAMTNESIELDRIDAATSRKVFVDDYFAYVQVQTFVDSTQTATEDAIEVYNIPQSSHTTTLFSAANMTNFLLYKNYLLVTLKDSLNQSIIRIIDRSDTENVLLSDTISATIVDMLVSNEVLYIGINQDSTSHIRTYQLTDKPIFNQENNLDSLSGNLHQLTAENALIYGLSENRDSVGQLIDGQLTRIFPENLANNSVSLDRARNAIVIVDDILYGDFGADGNVIDLTNFAATQTQILPNYQTAVWDKINAVFYVVAIDSSNVQQLNIIDENGMVQDSSSDTLQTNSIDLAYNTVPELIEHETYFAQFGQQGFLPFQLLEDEDGHVLTYEITVFPMWQEVELEEGGFQITYTSFDFDQFSYKACDLWGDCDFGTVYLDVGVVGATTQVRAKDVQHLATFPQVTTQSLQLDVSFFEQEMLTLEIFNQKGQSMQVEKIWASDAVHLDVSNLVAGHYFILVRGKSSRGLARFSKI